MPHFYVVNVKHGNSAVLIDTQGIVVIDAGAGSSLLEFLCEEKITTIDVLLLSHADDDHIGGVMALINSGIEIKKVYLNSDASKKSDVWDDLIYSLYDADKNEKIDFKPNITPDLTGTLNQGKVEIEILAPSKYLVTKGCGGFNRNRQKITSNSISAVIRFVYDKKPLILLAGDIDSIGFADLANKASDIKAWVLVFPHHGGHAGNNKMENTISFTQRICEKIQPEHIIFSIGNRKGFPLKEVLETISLNLEKSCMYTTNYSDVFSSHIMQYPNIIHKNNVGSIHIDFEKVPLKLNFLENL